MVLSIFKFKSLFVITWQFSSSFWFENERYNNILLYTNKNTKYTDENYVRSNTSLLTFNNIITSLCYYFYQ